MATLLTLDALSIGTYQSCRRRLLLEADYRVVRVRPKLLFDELLRGGVEALAGGADPVQVAASATARFMEQAADPGLDIPLGDPYRIVRDWCAMLDTVLRSVARGPLPVLHAPPPRVLNASVSWRYSAWADDSGALHRWVTAAAWDDDALARELHSSWVVGDIVMARTPMVVHVVEIGSQRDGRRASPWARAWRNPDLPNTNFHFRTKNGHRIKGWKAVYLADIAHPDLDAWVEQMWREGAAQPLLRTVDVRVPSEAACVDAERQVLLEALRMRELLLERPSYA